MDREAWRATVHGVIKSMTQLNRATTQRDQIISGQLDLDKEFRAYPKSNRNIRFLKEVKGFPGSYKFLKGKNIF